MRMKKVFMAILIAFVIMNVICMNFATVHAAGDLLDGVIAGMKNVKATPSEIADAQNVINTVIGLIQIAGTGIAIIVITILGIKYMTASAGEKADIKKQAIPIVIGCMILFLAVNIIAIVADFGDTLNNIAPTTTP